MFQLPLKDFEKDRQASQHGSIQNPSLLIISICSFLMLVAVLAWFALDRVKEQIQTDVGDALRIVLQTTQESLSLWAESKKFHLTRLAQDPRLVSLTERQLMAPRNKIALSKSENLKELRAFFMRHKNEFGQAGFFIIAPDFINIASMRDSNMGSKNLIANQALDLLNRAFEGETVMVPPIWSDVPLITPLDGKNKMSPTMFFAAPVKNKDGAVIAVVTQRLDPLFDFSRMTQLGRIGESGETYAFGRYGKLLSASRFDEDLRKVGLLGENENSILSVSIRDPGGDMIKGFSPTVPRYQQPLTLMAREAIQGKSGFNVAGYRDYRGVPVYGAWLWDYKLGIGLTTEIDEAEALRPYHTMRTTILMVLGVTVLLALGSLAFAIIVEQRARKALQKSHDELEIRVQERTADLKESEERFSLAVSAAGAGIWSLDPQSGEAWYSERFKELLGYSGAENQDTFPGWENSLHPDERDSISTAMQNHLVHHTPFNEVCRLKCKSGEYRWYRTMAQALWDEDGQAYRMAGSIVDITEGRLAQEQVAKLSRATENSPASVVITDKDGNIEYVNTTFCNVTGYSLQEAIGKNPRILKSGDLPELFYKNLWETILAGKTWKGDFINKKKNGDEFWESASISPIKNNNGEITHFVAVKQDITERKYMEKELIRAKQAADDANKSKGDFLANMSHEIRTPMNAVIGMAHLALKTDLTTKQRDYLNKIQSSANSLLGIINDILDFSKIEAGKLDMESVEFNLEDVMDNLANLITVKAQEKEDLEVLFSTNRDVPRFLVGDPLRLGQILINLSNNAVKFTDTGEIVVSTELLKRNEEQVTLKFSVSDTGIGLTKAQAGKLFQSFSQADTSTTRKYGGTGLGLTISKRLTEMMGGEIWVESKYGEGSTFIFTANFGLGKERAKRVFKPSKDLRGIRVLVVDDNATSRSILQEMLESFSFEVTVAASGEEGITELENADGDQPFELVIMDWKMPVMDGIEASKRIKEHTSLSKIPPIVMVTAYGREEVMQQADQVGLEGFLLKPVSPSMLFDAIMEVFGKTLAEVSWAAQRKEKKADVYKIIQGARILLVEDNEINQQVAKEILEGAGVNISIAVNGQEAVDAVKENNYDAVLMDVQMPVMDGYTATREIRNLKSEIRNVPIIAMTAHAMAGDEDKSLQAGMNGHVTKPIDPDQLFATLQKWLQPTIKRMTAQKPVDSVEAAVGEKLLSTEYELPESLPGFDLSDGLKRLQGNKRLYRKLLINFSADYRSTANDIRIAIDSKDFEQAHSLVHNLKGLAGNLAATDLQAAAVVLEKLVKGVEKKTPIAKELNLKFFDLENTLNQALDSAQSLSAPAEKNINTQSTETLADIPNELSQEIAKRIRDAAEMGDVSTVIAVAEELKSYSASCMPLSKKIIQMAEDFEFDGILQLAADLELC